MAKVSGGAAGEILAARYLIEKGYRLLATNYRSRFGEVDIIAENERFLVFVEVKTRGENAYFEPREAVTAAKQQKIIKASTGYIVQHPTDLQPRFDVIEVLSDPRAPMKAKEIRHLENAFDIGNSRVWF